MDVFERAVILPAVGTKGWAVRRGSHESKEMPCIGSRYKRRAGDCYPKRNFSIQSVHLSFQHYFADFSMFNHSIKSFDNSLLTTIVKISQLYSLIC